MKEVELGEIVIDWLKQNRPGWEVYQEIRHAKYAGSPVADIVCICSNSVWVIELKKSLNLDVIRQAAYWQVDYRSIAVVAPKTRITQDNNRWWFMTIRNLMGLGTIVYNPFGQRVSEYKSPALLNRNPFHQERFIEICQSGRTKGMAKAGGKDGGYWTPYKETMKAVKEYIGANPGCGIGDIVKALGKMHYSSEHSARTNLIKNLATLENDWCEVKRKGTYDTFYIKNE